MDKRIRRDDLPALLYDHRRAMIRIIMRLPLATRDRFAIARSLSTAAARETSLAALTSYLTQSKASQTLNYARLTKRFPAIREFRIAILKKLLLEKLDRDRMTLPSVDWRGHLRAYRLLNEGRLWWLKRFCSAVWRCDSDLLHGAGHTSSLPR